MPNSRAAAAVDPGRRLHTATISTSSIAFRPGICRDRVLAPAPIKPMRSEWVGMVHLNRDTMSIMATNQNAARSWRGAGAIVACHGHLDLRLDAVSSLKLRLVRMLGAMLSRMVCNIVQLALITAKA